jgi:hypothetical protein
MKTEQDKSFTLNLTERELDDLWAMSTTCSENLKKPGIAEAGVLFIGIIRTELKRKRAEGWRLLEEAAPLTVAQQITKWSEENYNESHAAQTVVEGCWDDGELEGEFETLQGFIEYAGVRDDCREDIISMGGE